MAASAFHFECDKTREEILSLVNQAGPWIWEMRDSYWYGDYLNCRPTEGLRVRIHDLEQAIGLAYRLENDPHKQGPYLTMQVDREPGCPIEAGDMLKIVNELFVKMGARNVVEIEPYGDKPRFL